MVSYSNIIIILIELQMNTFQDNVTVMTMWQLWPFKKQCKYLGITTLLNLSIFKLMQIQLPIKIFLNFL